MSYSFRIGIVTFVFVLNRKCNLRGFLATEIGITFIQKGPNFFIRGHKTNGFEQRKFGNGFPAIKSSKLLIKFNGYVMGGSWAKVLYGDKKQTLFKDKVHNHFGPL